MQTSNAQRLTFPVKNLHIYHIDFRTSPYGPDCSSCPEQVYIEMHQLSPETYEFYRALKDLNSSTDGVFSTRPSTPPSNFDNSALVFSKPH